MDFQVNLEFENINSPELGVYGVDHVKVVEGLGCKAIRVTDPAELGTAFEQAKKLAAELRVPVVVEAILERVTNISMSTTADISNVVEFEELATEPGHAPTAIRPLTFPNSTSAVRTDPATVTTA
jgi:tartronate-semialdehyde synthase